MRRGNLVAVLVTFIVLVGVLWGTIIGLGWGPQLGLDLQGGVSITLIPAPGQGEIDEEILDQTVSIIRERVDALGVAEPDIARQGDTVQVQLPGVADQEQAEDVIGRTAQLQFRRVLEVIPPQAENYAEVGPACGEPTEGPPPPDEEVVLCEPVAEVPADPDAAAEELPDLPADQWPKYRLGPVAVSGEEVEDAGAQLDPSGFGWQTSLEFTSEGEEAFRQLTAELACETGVLRQLAIVLDARIESAPPVSEQVPCGQGITAGGVITVGNEAEARELALVLRTGALPIQLEFATSQSVSPTLGRDALTGGLQAGFLGLALVAVYLMLLYRGMGLAAVAELAMFGILVYGLIIVLGETVGFTLTLAGIAGIIVSVGIAADSSIIYRERYRDEVRAGRTIRTAADHAFRKSFRTNLAGNTVSFIAAVVLYVLAVGPVRGFAFTLGLSTLIDTLLFATFTRALFGLVARTPALARSRLMGLRAETFSTTAPTTTPGGSTR